MARFILIHGAWHDARVWERCTPRLEALGHQVETPDLPGNGRDNVHPRDVTLALYTDTIGKVLLAKKEPAILVGHSMAGIVLSSVAERMPNHIRALVYLAAFMLPSGFSMVSFYEKFGEPWMKGARVYLKMSEDGTYSTIPPDKAKLVFCNTCDEATANQAVSHLGPMPAQPRKDFVTVTPERWGKLPRWYARTLKDETVFPKLQDHMIRLTPGTTVRDFDCDHSLFYSATDQLVTWLDEIAKTTQRVISGSNG